MSQVVNISIDQGSKFTYVFQLANTASLNLIGANTMGALAPEYDLAANSSVVFTSNLIGSNVVISLTDTQTANLTPGTWVYDVLVIDSSNSATRVVEGRAHVTPRVTQFP